MTPAMKTDPSSRSTRCPGPAKAPSAPASFQSPAPRLRSSTNGSNSTKPSAAPSREVLKPIQPPKVALAAIPTSNPGTVSQFGIRRLRNAVPRNSYDIEKDPSCDGVEQGGGTPACARKSGLSRGFSHSGEVKSMNL